MALEAEELELPDFLNKSSEEEIHEKMLIFQKILINPKAVFLGILHVRQRLR